MIREPVRHFLGVPQNSGPFALLGLRPGRYRGGRIDMALAQQLQRLDTHPDSGIPEAHEVRQRVVVAAKILRDPDQQAKLLKSFKKPVAAEPALLPMDDAAGQVSTPSPSGPAVQSGGAGTVASGGRTTQVSAAAVAGAGRPALRLTEFDRLVLAILVGSGGWNAESRARLVGLAAQYGVSVKGLIRVVTGLAKYAASGGTTLGVREITAGSERMAPPRSSVDASVDDDPQWTNRFAPELFQGGPWSTVKLSILFSVLTLFVGIVVTRFIIQSGQIPPAEDRAVHVHPAAPISPVPVAPSGATAGPTVPATPAVVLARFDPYPTFSGETRPAAAVKAAARADALPEEFDRIARYLYVREEAPGEATFRTWATLVDEVASSWPLLSSARRDAVHAAMFEVLFAAADAPSVSDRFLTDLGGPATRFEEPLDVWRNAWRTGMLAMIAGDDALSPATVDQARGRLQRALGVERLAELPRFEDAVAAWLDHAVPLLVERVEFDARGFDSWELWFSAQKSLGDSRRASRAYARAVGEILATGMDLSRARPVVSVLGRLLASIDFRRDRVVKETILGYFDDVDRIDASDLWALTSLLAIAENATWFDPRLAIGADATPATRRRKRSRLDRAWVIASDGSGLGHDAEPVVQVDDVLGRRFVAELARQMELDPVISDVNRARRLVDACLLTEAMAHAAVDETGPAHDLLDTLWPSAPDGAGGGVPARPRLGSGGIRQGTPRSSPARGTRPGPGSGRTSAPMVGQAIGTDGVWAAAFEQSRKDPDAQVQQLRVLMNAAGTDLGPLDAAVFVRAVYRGRSAEQRALAATILVRRFQQGPIVMLEMLDQFVDATVRESTSEVIEQVTGAVLPALRAPTWAHEARAALTQHALNLRRGELSEVDDLAEMLRRSCEDQLAILNRHSNVSMASRTAQDAARRLARAWREVARPLTPAEPAPADFIGIERRHGTLDDLGAGPIERFVAARIMSLEWLAFVTVAELPGRRDLVMTLLDEATRRRREMTHVLDQGREVEFAITRIWLVRMGLDDDRDWARARGTTR